MAQGAFRILEVGIGWISSLFHHRCEPLSAGLVRARTNLQLMRHGFARACRKA
jgi:hypothetical protein